MTEERPHRRLFFALWPSPEIRAGIVERRKGIKDLSRRRVPWPVDRFSLIESVPGQPYEPLASFDLV